MGMSENILKAISKEQSHSDLYLLSLIALVSRLCPMTSFLRNESFSLLHYKNLVPLRLVNCCNGGGGNTSLLLPSLSEIPAF